MSGNNPPVILHWFRKGLRLHDNPALVKAVASAKEQQAILRPIFVLDTELPKTYRIGVNRYRFLIQSLEDLDNNLKKLGCRLFVIRGRVEQVLEELFASWNVKLITLEYDTEPYSRKRDPLVHKLATKYNVAFEGFWSHTLYEPNVLLKQNNGQAPKTYQKFLDVMNKAGPPPDSLPHIKLISSEIIDALLCDNKYNTPTLTELKIPDSELGPLLYPGGETEALARLDRSLVNRSYVENFSKPNTSPNSLKPSTTVLSPYLKFGCLSARLFYEKLKEFKKTKTKPPVSLLGQLYWREFYYLVGANTPNFTQIQGNTICKQIVWDDNKDYFEAWKMGRTGYPFIG